MLRSILVPVICWLFFTEQQTNCFYVCAEWEIENEIKRNVVTGPGPNLAQTNRLMAGR